MRHPEVVPSQQAADMLSVSRAYLTGLLEKGAIPYRVAGKHRRVTVGDLMGYKRRDDLKRSAAARELGALGQELGI